MCTVSGICKYPLGIKKPATVSGLSARALKTNLKLLSSITGELSPSGVLVIRSVSIMPGDNRPAVTGVPFNPLISLIFLTLQGT